MDVLPARLLLVRHGETDWNRERRFQGWSDVPLNERGRAQSRALAERLARERIDAVYSSSSSRAAETARIVAARHGLVPVESTDLREGDMGAWAGLTYDEVRARHGADLARMESGEIDSYGGGESLATLQSRVVAALAEIGARHRGAHVLVVSHGFALRAAICALLGVDLANADRLTTGGNTGLTIFESTSRGPRMSVYGCTRHLEGVA